MIIKIIITHVPSDCTLQQKLFTHVLARAPPDRMHRTHLPIFKRVLC
jgi:hypothetical protein